MKNKVDVGDCFAFQDRRDDHKCDPLDVYLVISVSDGYVECLYNVWGRTVSMTQDTLMQDCVKL